MTLYAVYKLKEDGEFLVIPSECASKTDVILSEKHSVAVGSVHWYGAVASTEAEAIEKAIDAGYEFKSPEEMRQFHARLETVRHAAESIFAPGY